MVSRIHLLLFLLFIFLAGEAMALHPIPARSIISRTPTIQTAPTSQADRALRRSPRALPKTAETQRKIKAQPQKQSQDDAAAAKLIIDQMVPKLLDPNGAWRWRYYDIVYKLEAYIRKHHFNAEVIKRLNEREMIIPMHTTHFLKTGRYKGKKFNLTGSPSSELKEVMAEVWVQQQLHKSATKRRLFLGYDWQDGKTYQSYLEANTPNISSLSEDNIMNLPVWTRYRLVEDRIRRLTSRNQQGQRWNRTQIARELGYDKAQHAAPRWLTVNLLSHPKEMIQLLKSKEHFISPPKRTSSNAKAATAKPRRNVQSTRSTAVVTRSHSASLQKNDTVTAVRPRLGSLTHIQVVPLSKVPPIRFAWEKASH